MISLLLDFYEYRVVFFHMGQLATQSWLNLGLVKRLNLKHVYIDSGGNQLIGREKNNEKHAPRAALERFPAQWIP